MAQSGSASSSTARGFTAAPYLHPYTFEKSKQNGSRTRLLNAAKLCCNDQYLLTLCSMEDQHFPVCELQWYSDNDISAIMKRNLSERFYQQFLNFAWGTDLATQFLQS